MNERTRIENDEVQENKARREEAGRKAQSAAPGEHVTFLHLPGSWQVCIRCARIRPRTGWTKPCSGILAAIRTRGGR